MIEARRTLVSLNGAIRTAFEDGLLSLTECTDAVWDVMNACERSVDQLGLKS